MAEAPPSNVSAARTWRVVIAVAAAVLLAVLGAVWSSSNWPGDREGAVVFDDAGVLRVYVPWFADEEEWHAARELAEYLRKLSGRTSSLVRREPLFRNSPGIYVGDTRTGRRVLGAEPPEFPLPPDLWDNFDYVASHNQVILRGTDPGATALAVYWFLQEEVGVRWWAPSAIGEDLPSLERLELPPTRQTIRPGIVSRGMAPMSWQGRKTESAVWARRNLLRHRLSLSHNLHKIVPPLSEETRDLYPPPSRNILPRDAHPNLESATVRELAVAAATRYFNSHPEAPSFSLALADHLEFLDWSIYKSVDPDRTFRGGLDFTPLVFGFTDAVARELAKTHPGRYVSSLAYILTENAPDFPLSPNVIPTATADRSQWYDKDFREEDLALMRRWADSGVDILATWDYAYGYQYLIPRIYLEQQGQSVKALRDAGVDAFYIEIYPLWGIDAPKAWLYARLLWNPDADPEALLDEFFTGYYGSAADAMRRFFALAEAAWMTQPGPATWIKYYKDEHQALLFPPQVMQRLDQSLYRATVEADTPRTAKRVALAIEALKPLRRLIGYLPTRFSLTRHSDFDTPEGIGDLIEKSAKYIEMRSRLEEAAMYMLETDSLNKWPKEQRYLFIADPLPGRVAQAALAANASGSALPDQLRELLEDASRDGVLYLLDRIQASGRSRSANLLTNPRFRNELEGWNVYHWPASPIEIEADPATPTLTIRNAKYINIFQSLQAVEGVAYVASLPIRGSIPQWGAVHLQMEFFDEGGQVLQTHLDRAPPMNNEEITLCTAGVAPPGARWVRYFIHLREQGSDTGITFLRPLLQTF